MKKEVIIAVIAGLVLGLVITMGIYTANRSLNQQRAKKLSQNTPAPTALPQPGSKTVTLTSYENFDLVGQADVTLSGIAWNGNVVALLTDSDSQITQADAEGIFVFKTRLLKGFNEITLIASDVSGATVSQSLVLTYSTSKIELQAFKLIRAVYAAEETATAAADSVTDKIKERLQETVEEGLGTIKEEIAGKAAAPRKKAYIGKITSVDSTSLTLTYKEQNFNVNTGDDTVYVKGASGSLKREDLEPGDFVIAMGFYLSESQEFRAVRVSRIAAPEPPANRQLVTGKISEVDGQKVSANGNTLNLTKKTKFSVSGLDEPEISDLALGDNLFALVTLDNNGDIDSVDNVLVLPGKNNPASLTPTNLNSTGSAEASPSSENEE